MSDERRFRCPVCRARQPLQDRCRRCQADLALVVRAHRRMAFLQARRQQARAEGDHRQEYKIALELSLLSPERTR